MKAKFAPGPWSLSRQSTYVRAVGGWNIAKIEDQEPYTKSNANLIAAAPEMYELLRKGLEDGDPMNWDEVSELLDKINNHE